MTKLLNRAFGVDGRREAAFLLLVLVAGASLVVALNRHVDPDLFWQLRGGRDILKAGRVALPDSWTYLFAGRPWVNQQWASELLFYAFFHAGGYAGLQLLKGLLAGGMLAFLLAALRSYSPVVRYATAAVVLAGTGHYLIFRTHLLSLLCFAALVCLLERLPAKARLPWLALLFAAWANLHALFSLGLAVLGCVVLVRWLQGGFRFDAEALWGWASIPAAFAATLANPFGWGVWRTAASLSGDPVTGMITEWWPIWRHSLDQNLGFLFVVALIAILGALFPRRIHWPSLAASLPIALLGVRYVRFTADFPLPAVPLVACLLAAAAEEIGPDRVNRALSRLVPAATGLLVVATASACSFTLSHPLVTPGEVMRADYPVRAVAWMKRHHLSGRIFDEYAWGGYLCWELPDSKVFIDPRTGVLLFPKGFVGAWKDAVETQSGWRETFERGHPDFVLLLLDDYLSAQLAAEPGWRVLYKDNMSVLFGRRDAGGPGEQGAER